MFTTNNDVLQDLFARGAIRIRRGVMFDSVPAGHSDVPWDRIQGMMLGLAIGDSLGNCSESMMPLERRIVHGELIDFMPNFYADGRPVGLPSDDTQLAAWTLEQLIEDGKYIPENVAKRFQSGHIFGIGQTVREFLRNLAMGRAWHEAGPESAGNGAIMRIAPILIPHLGRASTDLWVDTALAAMTTHNDMASISSCIALVAILWDLLGMQTAPEPTWWLDRFVGVVRDLDYGARYGTRAGSRIEYEGSFADFVEASVRSARTRNLSIVDACNRTGSGAYLMETVPSVLTILERHANDPESAIIRAVNDTWDNDSIGAIVGAAVGALHGANALPSRWREGLLGRTRADDDGRLFDLLGMARTLFGPADVAPID